MKHLSNIALDNEFSATVKSERKIMHEVLLYIQEIDRRSLYLSFGYDSLVSYLVKRHHYSEGPARERVNAMRMLAAVPEIKDQIQDGTLTLTQLSMAQSAVYQKQNEQKVKVSPEEKRELLMELENKTTEQTKIVIAEVLKVELPEKRQVTYGKDETVLLNLRFSKEEYALITKCLNLMSHQVKDSREMLLALSKKHLKSKGFVPPKDEKAETKLVEKEKLRSNNAPNNKGNSWVNDRANHPASNAPKDPTKSLAKKIDEQIGHGQIQLSLELTKIQKANKQTQNAIQSQRLIGEQKAMLTSVIDDAASSVEKATPVIGNATPSVEKAALIVETATQCATATEKSCRPQIRKRTRYIKTGVSKNVFRRDDWKCQFEGVDGHICGSEKLPQIHHVQAFAKGGDNTLSNLSLRCRKHNLYEAELEGLAIF